MPSVVVDMDIRIALTKRKQKIKRLIILKDKEEFLFIIHKLSKWYIIILSILTPFAVYAIHVNSTLIPKNGSNITGSKLMVNQMHY